MNIKQSSSRCHRTLGAFSMAVALATLPAALLAAEDDHAGHSHAGHDHHGKGDHADNGGHREQGVHVHGEGRLTIAISEHRVDVALSLPADSAFGFEHAPTSAAETAAVANTLEKLRDARQWLGGLADCETAESSLADPFAADDKRKHDTHRDLEGSWTLTCKHLPEAIDVGLFGRLDKLERLDVEWVTDKGAGALEMSPDVQQLKLP
jgi:hypothetical protein